MIQLKKLLITGFEPFGGYQENPSQIIAQELHGKTISKINITGWVIPLKYNEIAEVITTVIDEIRPNYIITMGQAPRPSISFEKVAINLANASRVAYNCGSTPNDEILIKGGPVAYFSTLPIKELVLFLEQHQIPSYTSYSAGTFGCNQIFYHTMHHINNEFQTEITNAGFIHLPLLPEQTLENPHTPSMNLDTMKNAIKLVIEFLGK